MSAYFGRRARVLVKQKGEPDLVFPVAPGGAGDVTGQVTSTPQPGQDFFSQISDKIHIKFHAEKDNLGQPNRLDLSIFNLARNTRGRMQAGGGYVVLQAGYVSDGQNLPTVFEGNARTIDHQRDGPNWVTRIQCGDGETCYQYARVNQAWAAGTAKADIARDIAKQIQAADTSKPKNIKIDRFLSRLSDTNPTPATITFPQPQFWAGYSTYGNAFDELQRLLGPRYELSFQNGELVALAPSQTITSTAIVLDAAHGLLGSPEHCAPNPGTLQSILKAACLLNARIVPSGLIQIKSVDDQVSGAYRVQKVAHLGDLAGNDWQSEMELIPLIS